MPKRSSSRYGNRKSAGAPKSKVIRVRCPAELEQDVKELADLNEIEVSKFLREAAAHYVKHLTAGGDRHVVLPSEESGGGN